MSKVKFGIFLPFYGFKTKEPGELFNKIRSITLECEKLGYHSIWLDDHLMYNDWPIFECWTTLSALSSITSKIRLGTMVSCIGHRNPALLAKMAATLDVLSGGRLEFGAGAGVQDTEHISYGFDFPQPKERIERLSEALEIMLRLWTENRINYQGEFYSIQNATCEPKPMQKPYPPITVGGSGNLLLKKATSAYADRFDFGYLPSTEIYKRKLEVLKSHCQIIGRDFSEIEKSCWPGGQVLIAQTRQELEEKIALKNVMNLPLQEFKKTTLLGTPEECIKQLKVYLNLGVTFFMLFFADLPNLDGLRLFAENVKGKIC